MYTKLKEMRYSHKMTAQQMSEKLGISKPFYCQIENQTRRLSYDMSIRIASIFHTKPDKIFYEDHLQEKNGN